MSAHEASAGRRPARLVLGRPIPVCLVALEKAVSALGAAAGAVLALVLHARGGTGFLHALVREELSEDPHNFVLRWVLHHLPPLDPRLTLIAGAGLAFFTLLLGAEAIGVWLRLGWSELLIIFETGVFLVPEVWQVAHRPQLSTMAALFVNLLIFLYVGGLYRVRMQRRAAEAEAAASRPAGGDQP